MKEASFKTELSLNSICVQWKQMCHFIYYY